jgi:glycine/D-amino acid oxidase-like deaminating enzyme
MLDYYAAVFGAGISGLSMANQLQQRGKKVLLIDPFRADPEAPGPPAAMVNPSAGRKGNLVWESEKCLNAFRSNIDKLSKQSGRNDLFNATGVLRPAITEELAENFKLSLKEQPWPEGWVEWLEPNEIEEINPGIAKNYGGYFIKPGLTVFVDNYLNTFRKALTDEGVTFSGLKTGYEFKGSDFVLTDEEGNTASAEHVIVCAGADTPGFDDWAELGIQRVKGQVVIFETDQELPWMHGLSALGYILRREPNELIVGSTYEHHFDDVDITDEAYNRLFGKLEKILPEISTKVKKTGQLAGVRATAPNHLPVLGRHRNNPQLCIYSAMGSKGLIYSEYMASILADHLVSGSEIPEELDTERIYRRLRKKGKID